MRPFADVRERRGLTLFWAAIALGISRSYLRQLELGQRPLSLALAERMAVVYRCSVDDLVRASVKL